MIQSPSQKLFRSGNFSSVSTRSLGKPAAAFPGRVATDADMAIAVDQQQTTLAIPMSVSDTSMTVANPSVIAAWSLLSIDAEIVQATGPASGNVVPVSRGFDGTTPAVHLASATVSGFIDAYHHNRLVAEVEAIEAALGPNLSSIPGSAVYQAKAYNFPAIAASGSLNAGSNVITMNPVPAGLAIGNSLYISGGTGAAEAVPITGITGNQVIVTCANAHSGAWTIQSASFGWQEAIVAAGTAGGGTVYVAAGTHLLQGTVNLSYNNITVQGAGGMCCGLGTWIHRTGDFGDSLYVTGNAVNLFDFGLSQDINYASGNPGTISNKPTHGAQIHAAGVNTANIQRLRLENMPQNLLITGGVNITVRDCQFGGLWDRSAAALQVTSASLKINQSGSNIPSLITLDNNAFYGNSSTASGKHNVGPKYMIELDAGEDILIQGGSISGANSANLYMYANGSFPLLNVRVLGVKFDSAWDADVIITGDGTTTATVILIEGNIFNGEYQEENAIYIPNLTSGSPPVYGLTITGNQTLAQLGSGFNLLDGTGFLISGNLIRMYNAQNTYTAAAGASAIYLGGRANKGLIENNTVGGDQTFSNYGSGFNYCIFGIQMQDPVVAQSGFRLWGNYPPYYAAISSFTDPVFSTMMFSFPGQTIDVGPGISVSGASCLSAQNESGSANMPLEVRATTSVFPVGPVNAPGFNYIASETGTTNAIAGTLANIPLTAGLRVTVHLSHSLQAGVNTFAYNGGAALAIMSGRNPGNNIATGYVAAGMITLQYDGTRWLDISQ